MISEKGKFDQF